MEEGDATSIEGKEANPVQLDKLKRRRKKPESEISTLELATMST